MKSITSGPPGQARWVFKTS